MPQTQTSTTRTQTQRETQTQRTIRPRPRPPPLPSRTRWVVAAAALKTRKTRKTRDVFLFPIRGQEDTGPVKDSHGDAITSYIRLASPRPRPRPLPVSVLFPGERCSNPSRLYVQLPPERRLPLQSLCRHRRRRRLHLLSRIESDLSTHHARLTTRPRLLSKTSLSAAATAAAPAATTTAAAAPAAAILRLGRSRFEDRLR